MARRPSLKPKQTTKEHAPWLVELPPALSGSGIRERRYFKLKKDAEDFGRQQRIRLENFGTASSLLPAGKTEEAAAAFELLAPFRVTLLEVVNDWISRKQAADASVTFDELIVAFRGAKDRSAKYLRDLRQLERRCSEWKTTLVCNVTPDAINALLGDMTAAFRNLNLRMLRAVLNYGLKRGWLRENPVLRLDFAVVKSGEVHVLSVEEVKRLMRAAVEIDPALVPYHAVTLFAGLRPMEAERLDWAAIDFTQKHIEVSAEVSKTGRKRFVTIEPTLRTWLRWHMAHAGNKEGPLTPLPKRRQRLRAVRKKAGLTAWVQDASRHTFASCWLARYGEIDTLCRELGHTSPKMLWKHYHKAVTPKQAMAFWRVAPPAQKHNELPVSRRSWNLSRTAPNSTSLTDSSEKPE